MILKVFTIPHCGECQAVKEFLRSHGIPFEELNVADNFANLRQMRRLTAGRRVPVTAWGGDVVVGYNPEAIIALMAKKEDATHEDGA